MTENNSRLRPVTDLKKTELDELVKFAQETEDKNLV